MNWTAEDIVELATAYWKSAALSAAVDLKLFDAVRGEGLTAEAAARHVHASPLHTEVLLNALVGLGLLEKAAGRYRLEPSAAPWLDRSSPHCLLGALQFNLELVGVWAQLATCVREGRCIHATGESLDRDAEWTERFVCAMHSRAQAIAPALLPALRLDGCTSLLDVAAGPGTFSCLLADKYAGLRVTLFDLPAVLEVAKRLVGERSAAARLTFHPGDYSRDRLPGGFDAVLFSGALHQEPPAAAAEILCMIYHSLRPGGTVYVIDMLLHSDRARPVFSSLFALHVLLAIPAGRIYTEQELCRLLEDAGFLDATCLQPADSPYWVVKARKPWQTEEPNFGWQTDQES